MQDRGGPFHFALYPGRTWNWRVREQVYRSAVGVTVRLPTDVEDAPPDLYAHSDVLRAIVSHRLKTGNHIFLKECHPDGLPPVFFNLPNWKALSRPVLAAKARIPLCTGKHATR